MHENFSLFLNWNVIGISFDGWFALEKFFVQNRQFETHQQPIVSRRKIHPRCQKNWSICIPPLNSLQNMLLQAEIDIIFNSQIIRHICGWIYKDFCRHLLIRDWCRTEIVLKVKDWIWLWLTSRNGDLWLFFLNWNKLQKGTIVGDYGTQEWFWF